MRRNDWGKPGVRTGLQKILPPIAIAILLLVGIFVFYNVGNRVPEMDDRLCPKESGPVGATVLLLDTSDPLTPKHRAELERLARQIKSDDASGIGINPGELLVVYELQQDPSVPKQLIEICRPYGSPKDRTWRDDIHQGKRVAERNWEHFEDALAAAFPEQESEPQPTSPLLETIAVIAPLHSPGKRGDERFTVHFIIFSDLLQHTSRLSHYGSYPSVKSMRKDARDLLSDLTGARVSIFRLERSKYKKWQTKDHYYWWTELINEQGGQIVWQDSI